MPLNKNALIRYIALDKCFRDQKKSYTIESLLEQCNGAIKEFDSKAKSIKKRQLYDDISSMKSKPFSAPIKTYYPEEGRMANYSYEDFNFSIFNSTSLKEKEVTDIKAAILVLRSFKGLPQLDSFEKLLPKLNQSFALDPNIENIAVVAFDKNPFLKGMEHFPNLFQYIKRKLVLKILYHPFSGQQIEYIIHPYFLKEYNNRWFLLGKNPEYDSLTNLPLDRIVSITALDDEDYEDTIIDFQEYFEDVIGVTIPENSEVEKIEIYADESIKGYISTKPLHESQTPLRKFEKGYKFSIKVIPNPELESVILSFGEKIKILSPESLKDRLKMRLLESVKQYNEV